MSPSTLASVSSITTHDDQRARNGWSHGYDLLVMLSDDELSAIALAADPDVRVADDAVCLWDLDAFGPPPLLPAWYMPSPMGGPAILTGWRRRVARLSVAFVIVSMLVINAYGLCNTYGQLNFG